MGVVVGALLLLFATARYGDGEAGDEVADDHAEQGADQPADGV